MIKCKDVREMGKRKERVPYWARKWNPVKKNAEMNKMSCLRRNNWGRPRKQKRKSRRKQPEYFWQIVQFFNGKENLLHNPAFQKIYFPFCYYMSIKSTNHLSPTTYWPLTAASKFQIGSQSACPCVRTCFTLSLL